MKAAIQDVLARVLVAKTLSILDAYDYTQETMDYFEDLVDLDCQWDFKPPVLEALGCEGEVLPSGMLMISDLDIKPEYRGNDFGL